jgi:colicin import membrane protein
MKYPSIHKATAASFMIHCVFFAALFLTAKKHARYIMPSPYTVRIVTETMTAAPKSAPAGKPPEEDKPAEREKPAPAETKAEKPAPREPSKTRVEVNPKPPPAKEKPKEEPLRELKKPSLVEKPELLKKPPVAEKKIAKAEPLPPAEKTPEKKDAAVSGNREEQVRSRIARMMVEKRIADISRSRAIVDIKKGFQEPPGKHIADGSVGYEGGKTGEKTGSRTLGQPGDRPAAGADLGGSIVNEYLSSVVAHVRSNWAFPDTGIKGLSAVVTFTVKSDGKVEKLSLEQSSGNALFDRSVINAVNKSAPLRRPPFELDVGVRFYP